MNNPGTPPNWTPFCPPFESQYSVATHTDAQDCVEESLCHILYMMTGIRFSPRALGYLTDVTPTGSSVAQALLTANNNGLIPYDLWPTPDSFTWESYYAPIPQNILAKGISLGLELIPPDLNKSPLWTEISLGIDSPGVIATKHMVAQISGDHISGEYFDSEEGGPIKSFVATTPILYQTSILITKPMPINEAVIVKSKNSPKVYVCYPMPSMDYLNTKASIEGFVVPSEIPNSDSL